MPQYAQGSFGIEYTTQPCDQNGIPNLCPLVPRGSKSGTLCGRWWRAALSGMYLGHPWSVSSRSKRGGSAQGCETAATIGRVAVVERWVVFLENTTRGSPFGYRLRNLFFSKKIIFYMVFCEVTNLALRPYG